MAITLKKAKKSKGRILYSIKVGRGRGTKTIKSMIDREKAIKMHNSLKSIGARLESFDTDTQVKKFINN